jgi:NAD(P)-dependent dehydrogenase (short-subunit alcohol dehydrogenase family)
MDVSGKVAVVTGGASGIGKGIAQVLAEAGATVVIADIMEASARKTADEIGRGAVAVVCDVSERTSVAEMKAEVSRRLGPVGVLIANAGVTVFEELTRMSDDDVDWVIDVSLYGVTHCIQAFLPEMIAAREGHIVATASAAALMAPFVGEHAPYCAAKAGIIGMILSLRADLGKYNVGASVLCPGAVQSQIHGSPRYRPAQYGGPRDGVATMPQDVRAIGRPAVEAGQMVLNAIRNDRPVIVTDPSHRSGFEQGFMRMVLEAFDDAAAYDARLAAKP